MRYEIEFTPEAREMFDGLGNKETKRIIRDRIAQLAEEPEKRGKGLAGTLKGLRSIRVAGRHRVIYRIQEEIVTVLVVAVGLRKGGAKTDIYQLAERLARMNLIE